MPTGIRKRQGELGRDIFDIVHDEGEPAVETFEPLDLGEPPRGAVLGKIGGGFAGDHTQQVPLLAIEGAVHAAFGEYHDAEQPFSMVERQQEPRMWRCRYPGGQGTGTRIVAVDEVDRVHAFHMVGKDRGKGGVDIVGTPVDAEVAHGHECETPAGLREPDGAAGRFHHIGHGKDDTVGEAFGRMCACTFERAHETGPFITIIEPVAEKGPADKGSQRRLQVA